MNRHLKPGQSVKLSPDTSFQLSNYNPRDTTGEVIRIPGVINTVTVVVQWSNGFRNFYRGDDSNLIAVD